MQPIQSFFFFLTSPEERWEFHEVVFDLKSDNAKINLALNKGVGLVRVSTGNDYSP